MKKLKKAAAFCVAVGCILTPILFASCNSSSTAELPPVSESTENSVENSLPESSKQESSTPESSTPEDSSSSTPPVVEKAQYIRCSADNVNIRSGAGTSYSVLGSAEKGTTYAVLGKSGNWYKTYYRGKIAYLHAEYATVFTMEKSEDSTVEDVLSEGYKLVGVPYVYGAVRLHDGNGKLLSGFSAQKFDCSSLVQYVFYKGANELLQVTTRTQVKQGVRVQKSQLQRGDCLFFTNESREHLTGVERVGHVAIYLGDNYILHTASDYARIEKISTKRWSYYIEARRFI